MANLRIKLFGLAGASFVFAGMAFGQAATCAANPILSTVTRLESGSDLVAEGVLTCSTVAGTAVAAGTLGTTDPAITLFVGAPVTSKLLQTAAAPAVQYTEALAVVSGLQGVGVFSATQGVITPAGVAFSNIPTPGLAGVAGASIFYTITFVNVRVNSTGGATSISEQAFITGNAGGMNVVTPGATASTVVATVNSGITAAKLSTDQANAKPVASTGINETICTALNTQSSSTTTLAAGVQTPAFWVHTGETFQTSFKNQGSAANATLGSEFLANTETGVVPPANGNSTTGLPFAFNQTSNGVSSATNIATSGTRVKLIINNIPSGLALYVPLVVNNDGYVSAPTLTGTLSLTTSETGVFGAPTAVTAAGSFGTFTAPAGFVGAAILNVGTVAAVTVSGGSATIVYEVTAQSPTAVEAYSIPIFFSASAGTLAVTTAPMTVTTSFAPVAASLAAPLTNIPSFVSLSTALTVSNETSCSTTLLFPYVTQGAGFDVGLAIENTSLDNLGTAGKSSATNQTGTCALNFYGTGGNITPSAAGTPFTAGGATTAFSFTAGSGAANLLSVLNPGFTGYIIASCNFQFAHAYAYIFTNFGTANATVANYLALVLPEQAPGARVAPESIAH